MDNKVEQATGDQSGSCDKPITSSAEEQPVVVPDNDLGSTSLSNKDNEAPPIDSKLSETVYQDAGYNRNSTLIAKYVNRILKDFPTPSERYYDIRLVSSVGRKSYFGEVGDQCVMFHSNRVCLLTISPTHPVIVQDKTIDRIEHTFEGFEKIDRLASKPQGKSKKGGQKLQKNSPVCAIVCSDGTKYVVTACIGSKLIEINELICSKPDLVKESPLSSGFIAIIQPNDWKRMVEIRNSLPKLGQHEDVVNKFEEKEEDEKVNPEK